MTSILEKFAYGNLSPKAQPFHRNSRYNEVMQPLTRSEEYLLERLNKEGKTLFERYIDAQDELNRLTMIGDLIYGYKLRVTVTTEVFVGMDDLFQHRGSR